jgi:hypothetical protein
MGYSNIPIYLSNNGWLLDSSGRRLILYILGALSFSVGIYINYNKPNNSNIDKFFERLDR